MTTSRQPAGEFQIESALELRAILASTLDPVITIDTQGIIRVASNSTQRVFGWAPEELVGRNVNVLMPEPHRSMHDGYLDNYRRTRLTSILGRTREFMAVTRDGTEFPIELSVSKVDLPEQSETYFTAVVHDISDRQRAERESRLLQDLTIAVGQAEDLETAMSAALQAVCDATGWDYGEAWLPDPEGQALYNTPVWHAKGERLDLFQALTQGTTFKYGEGLPGRVWASRRPEWLDDVAQEDLFVRAEKAAHAGLRAGVAVPVLAGSEVAAVMAFFMRERAPESERLTHLVASAASLLGPVIQRKRAEEELDQYRQHLEELVDERSAELEATHGQLRTADRLASIGTLAAGLGHDMNNVLLPVRSRLDALEAETLPREVREHVDEIRKATSYLAQLASGLHDLALDPEGANEAIDTTDLQRWWPRVAPLLARSLPRHVELTSTWPDRLPPVAVPPHRLTQAVLNLLVNAGEAIGDAGQVCVWAEHHGHNDHVRVGVTDDGEGMTAEVRERALDPFFTTKKRGLGTGLGLSLVRGVALSAGGSVDIESELGEGTTVTLTLRTAESVAPAGTDDVTTAVVSLPDRRAASLIGSILESAGCSVRYDRVGDPGSVHLWITEASPEALPVARRFLATGDRQVVAVGLPRDEWKELGASLIEDPFDFSLMRQQIGALVSNDLEGTPSS
ncbi:MAG: PAS domain S-box protein [Planctomycetes bacterium]|nr:PAS domain S-box protein [Planctomycetota bacterium]